MEMVSIRYLSILPVEQVDFVADQNAIDSNANLLKVDGPFSDTYSTHSNTYTANVDKLRDTLQ